LYIETKL